MGPSCAIIEPPESASVNRPRAAMAASAKASSLRAAACPKAEPLSKIRANSEEEEEEAIATHRQARRRRRSTRAKIEK